MDELLSKIQPAQAGDEQAMAQLVTGVHQRWDRRINMMYTNDVMVSREDLHAEFVEGVIRAVPIVKMDLNDPVFHLGKRGMWRVYSRIRYTKQEGREGNNNALYLSEAEEVGFSHRNLEGHDFTDDLIDQIDARRRLVKITFHPQVTGRVRQALFLVLAGEVGDPDELGFNKRLASRMGISPQRASQVMAQLRKMVTV